MHRGKGKTTTVEYTAIDLKSQLNAANRIDAINTLAVPVVSTS